MFDLFGKHPQMLIKLFNSDPHHHEFQQTAFAQDAPDRIGASRGKKRFCGRRR
jgi:hypothetical protein